MDTIPLNNNKLRPLGQLLSHSFSFFKENATDCAAILSVALAPAALLLALGPSREAVEIARTTGDYSSVGTAASINVIVSLLGAWASVAVVLTLAARLRGERYGVIEAYAHTKAFLIPLILTGLRATLWIILGLILLIVPGIVLAIRYSLVYYTVLLEKRKGADALARSKELVLAHMGKVVGNGIVITALTILIALIAAMSVRFIFYFIPGSGATPIIFLRTFIEDLLNRMIGIWGIAFFILLYQDIAALHPSSSHD